MADRTALTAWRAHRPDADVLLHFVEPTQGVLGGTARDGDPGDDLPGVRVVRSPRSGASFFGLGGVQQRFDDTRVRTARVLEGA
jgi:hypothetical protein